MYDNSYYIWSSYWKGVYMSLLETILNNSSLLVEVLTITGIFIGFTEWRIKGIINPFIQKLDDEIKLGHEEHSKLYAKIDKVETKLWTLKGS